MHDLAARARAAARELAVADTDQKNKALVLAAEELLARRESIVQANAEDLERGRANGLAEPMLDRLKLTPEVLGRLAEGLEQVAALPDPVGAEIDATTRPNGLVLRRVRVPIGTILIVFESRPNVTIEAGSLCLKAGNACILRGGSEAAASNRALAGVLSAGLKRAGLNPDAVSVPETTAREAVGALLELDQFIDLVIPRGGESLIRAVTGKARMPVLKHYKGICHVYIDKAAEAGMARQITVNSKLQRVSVCNSAETLLIHQDVAAAMLPDVARELIDKGCALRADEVARKILADQGLENVSAADEHTFATEHLDKILSVRVVKDIQEAMDHIERFGSRHTETIVTDDAQAAERFQRCVDSSSVFVNASTRLADGFEYGLGAEIGIATDKLHARGPMGLQELTTYKWLGQGTGQLRD